ncbi:conjugal transfer protein TrbI [Mesorhizobium tianshanense]|uniref:Type IV secretion system protein VirB10 n=1 Tax=Mesorhizobium tianshanense TaxID=39844 RepID=A0A562NBK5_9HYPH|nr:IncP-type conjugal transfer protein TrbI [Mesorhizobium tianshanense]TWI29536.1 type IV secretion system protein VirB10 [Mesorhizobium tianshanense]GLS34924.1 conjugal transfer protein TrbI [Mesorhizobium tianshanense]
MTETLKLGGGEAGAPHIRRLNRLPVIVAIILVVLFLGVIVYGLSNRGIYFRGNPDIDTGSDAPPASTYGDQLKRGVGDGIIGEPAETPFQPSPPEQTEIQPNPFSPKPAETAAPKTSAAELEPEDVWRARLRREQQEQYLREQHRQQMARLQADDAAYDSPIAVNLKSAQASATSGEEPGDNGSPGRPGIAADLYSAALKAGLGGQNVDPNGQESKAEFFNQDIKELGYLPNQVVPQFSRYELKRGSVIPATLVTGINSDLPGRITAQVSQNVFDSATGHHLLIPQGSKLFGRYDSKVAFGQKRVLVVWTDIIFPNGSTLQIGGMAGTDAAGYGGFSDKVDNHYLRTFGSAILIALIGAGTDMAIPESSTLATQDTASDAARRSFAETFGRVAERTISKNLDVQPTLEIRPGYRFNVLVDQDILFPAAHR